MKIVNLKNILILASLAIIFFSSLSSSEESSRNRQNNLKTTSSAVAVKKVNVKLVKKGKLKKEVKKSPIRIVGKNTILMFN